MRHFYKCIDPRPVRVICVDSNPALMRKNAELARRRGYDDIEFHGADVKAFRYDSQVDVVCSLHGCDTATDKTLYFGLSHRARHILTVSCCQHGLLQRMRTHVGTAALTRHRVFRERLAYMLGDAMRVMLLEARGYHADVLEFVSSRATDMNVLLRATLANRAVSALQVEEVEALARTFRLSPALAGYLNERN